MRDIKKMFVPRRKIEKLHESSVRGDFSSYLTNFKENSEPDTS